MLPELFSSGDGGSVLTSGLSPRWTRIFTTEDTGNTEGLPFSKSVTSEASCRGVVDLVPL
jgi:hypothetical protein